MINQENRVMSEQVMEELWNGLSPAADRTDLANAVIDRLLELKIDLQEVSLSEMKMLLARAYSNQARVDSQKRSRRISDCVVAS
jgi:hypothetical protein|tara:strand:+ start:22838 stop:23089 length:252 start_codon:yes stop_codon:yes gene_type:complete